MKNKKDIKTLLSEQTTEEVVFALTEKEEYLISVTVRDAVKAHNIIQDNRFLRDQQPDVGYSNQFVFDDEQSFYDALEMFRNQNVEIDYTHP